MNTYHHAEKAGGRLSDKSLLSGEAGKKLEKVKSNSLIFENSVDNDSNEDSEKEDLFKDKSDLLDLMDFKVSP